MQDDISLRESSEYEVSCFAQEPASDSLQKRSFNKEDLYAASEGKLFGHGSPKLPSGPLLMIDSVTDISTTGGDYSRGYAIAEFDITPSLWFFQHHFRNEPLVPGCLLIESLWQLSGFHLAWSGYKGSGRVVNSGNTRFLKEIKNETQTLHIEIQIRKVFRRSSVICIVNGSILSDEDRICETESMKIGLF